MDLSTKIVGSLYEAIDPRNEAGFVALLRAEFDASNAGFCLWDQGVRNYFTYVHSDIPASVLESFNTEMTDGDPWIAADRAKPRKTKALRGIDIISQKEVHASPMYHKFMRPFNLEYMLCCASYVGQESGGFVSIHRSPDRGDFDLLDRSKIAVLESHIDRVSRLRSAQQLLTVHHFNQFGPCLEVRSDLTCFINEAGQELERLGAISYKDGRVRFVEHDLQTRYEHAVNQYFNNPDGLSEDFGRILRSESGSTSLVLLGKSSNIRKTDRLLVFIQMESAHFEYLRAHGLSIAESLVGDALARGDSLSSVAEHLNKSIHTIRSQCKSLLAKTNSTSQSDFVRRVILRTL